jgi:hypothetical protein
MIDYKDSISSHVCNDDERLYSFVRNTGLPRGTFDTPRITFDRAMWIACAVVGIFLLAWAAA